MTGSVSNLSRALVRKRVEAQMLASIQILRGTLGTLDRSTGLVSGLTNVTVIYSGIARIHGVQGAGSISVAQAPLDQRQATISIPWDAAIPQRDDLLQVALDDAADPTLDAQTFRVGEVWAGSLFGDARRLSCTQVAPSRWWSPS